VEITIRRAKPADREWILPLAPRLIEFGPPKWRPISAMNRAVTEAIDRALVATPPGSVVFVAEDGDQPLGFIHVETTRDYFTDEAHGHVSDLVVDRGGEGRGVGRALMSAAEAGARDRGYRLMSLNVFEDNHRARALYERLGYRPDTFKLLKDLTGSA
jgi:ribosomal protein S18 acetylase RimI-like enzyme